MDKLKFEPSLNVLDMARFARTKKFDFFFFFFCSGIILGVKQKLVSLRATNKNNLASD